ncbi:MAG: acetyltransferase [Proteobacteria bacterium]|nr:acetyltransferase [Burkholderiales bacterium]
MKFYDVFNGDADGLCAMHQLRLAEPREAIRITGVKRDIDLLSRVTAARGDELTVFDVSLEVNREALERALDAGARVHYFDHHFAGAIPQRPGLRAYIDGASDTCTSLIVDRFLNGKYRAWAVVAAFGDNLRESAWRAAEPLALNEMQMLTLRTLGECMNYNAYGETVDDLHYHPDELYDTLRRYENPLDFVVAEPVFEVLRAALSDDLTRASEIQPMVERDSAAMFLLPDAAWSRRISGFFSNRLSNAFPMRAHAVLTVRGGGYLVSVRAPASVPVGADALCRQFESGGGRSRAAGIQLLPEADLPRFIAAFERAFPTRAD